MKVNDGIHCPKCRAVLKRKENKLKCPKCRWTGWLEEDNFTKRLMYGVTFYGNFRI